ncbi:hypothetical protein D6777_03935 [Candidatus Woesearchaeota archaeon]|nr:MAG: hypothetical protein D6777_03935 [Candidatus Woesearchaeota archaeon]
MWRSNLKFQKRLLSGKLKNEFEKVWEVYKTYQNFENLDFDISSIPEDVHQQNVATCLEVAQMFAESVNNPYSILSLAQAYAFETGIPIDMDVICSIETEFSKKDKAKTLKDLASFAKKKDWRSVDFKLNCISKNEFYDEAIKIVACVEYIEYLLKRCMDILKTDKEYYQHILSIAEDCARLIGYDISEKVRTIEVEHFKIKARQCLDDAKFYGMHNLVDDCKEKLEKAQVYAENAGIDISERVHKILLSLRK